MLEASASSLCVYAHLTTFFYYFLEKRRLKAFSFEIYNYQNIVSKLLKHCTDLSSLAYFTIQRWIVSIWLKVLFAIKFQEDTIWVPILLFYFDLITANSQNTLWFPEIEFDLRLRNRNFKCSGVEMSRFCYCLKNQMMFLWNKLRKVQVHYQILKRVENAFFCLQMIAREKLVQLTHVFR